jgi:excisionase family DNA binding protein
MITEQGTSSERHLAQEVPRRSVPASEVQTTVRKIPSQPPPFCSEDGSGRRKPRRPVTVAMDRIGKFRTPVAWPRDAHWQTGSQLNPESETLASLVRRRRTAWTAEELAEVLSLSRKHIYKLAKKGRMPSLRIGGAIRFDPHATAAWLESKAIQ